MSSFSNLSYTLGGGTTAFQTSTPSRSRFYNVNTSNQAPIPTHQPGPVNQQNMVNFAAMASPAGMTPPAMYYAQVPSNGSNGPAAPISSNAPQNYDSYYPAGTTFMQSYQLPYLNHQGNNGGASPTVPISTSAPSSQSQNAQHQQFQQPYQQLQPQVPPQNTQMACHVKIGEPNQPAVVYPAGDSGAADTTNQEAPTAQWTPAQIPAMNHGDGQQNQVSQPIMAQYPTSGVIPPSSSAKQVHFGQYPGMEVSYGGQPVQAYFMQPEHGGTGDHSPNAIGADGQPPAELPKALDPKPAGVARKPAYSPCGKCQSCQYTSTKKERPLPNYPLLARPPKTNSK